MCGIVSEAIAAVEAVAVQGGLNLLLNKPKFTVPLQGFGEHL